MKIIFSNLKIKIFIIFFIIINQTILPDELERECGDLKKRYTEFGFIILNPQDGRIKLQYNEDMLYNKRYCPGSLLKPFVVLSYAKTNIIDINERHYCKGYTEGEISCWLGEGHKSLNLIQAIANSCNYYFYYFIKDKLDRKSYIDMLNEFHIDVKSDDININDNDFYKTSFGLGINITSKPIDIVFAYSALFNGGNLFDSNGNLVGKINLDDNLVDVIRQGMKESYIYGTSKKIKEKTRCHDIIAKTGTGANIINNKQDYSKNIGWVILFYPSYNPKLCMLVVVDKARSYSACLIAGELLNFIMNNGLK